LPSRTSPSSPFASPSRVSPYLVVAILIAAWWAAVRLSGTRIFPGPWDVVLGIVALAREGVLVHHIAASLMRVAVGYFGAVALAIPLGVAMGWYPGIYRALNPVIQMLRPISPIAWIPLAILWFGVGNASPIFLILLSSFFPMVVGTMAGVHSVERQYIRAAENFGITGLKLLRDVVVPAAMAQIVTGMRIGLGVAWLVVVAAEMVAINSGLGYLIIDSRNAGNRYDLVVAAMVIIGVIGFGLDVLMRRMERVDSVRWRYVR
jgi:NitT/TauT family transport system permease protein